MRRGEQKENKASEGKNQKKKKSTYMFLVMYVIEGTVPVPGISGCGEDG